MCDHTLWSHLVVPATSYLERDGTTVNLEGRVQRQRRAVDPAFPGELEFLSLVGERVGVPIAAWPTSAMPLDRAPLPAPTSGRPAPQPTPAQQVDGGGDGGLRLLTYRAAFTGAAVERIEALAFQRPLLEVEISSGDARARGIASGDSVAVSSNGTRRDLVARVNRRLRDGVVRIASEHADGLHDRVEVRKP